MTAYDVSPFGKLKRIQKDREFNSNDETQKAIALAWNDLTFGDMQNSTATG
jgi:hypothetical protein